MLKLCLGAASIHCSKSVMFFDWNMECKKAIWCGYKVVSYIVLSSMLTFHSLEYLMTMFLHCLLYSAMPILATSAGPLIPKVLSISYSYKSRQKIRQMNTTRIKIKRPPQFKQILTTGRPWQSQPKRRSTWKPLWWAKRVTMSFMVPARMCP